MEGQLTNFVTASYTKRYANTVSNSTRVFANFGNGKNDEGFAIISENSLISGLPSTLIPYANFFVGFGNPQPLVDGFNAGILKNVGINFETDALTGYPKLNDTGSNAYGGAHRLAVPLQSGSAARLRGGHGAALRRLRSPASAPQNRSTASVFAIRSRSTGPGCSAPMPPIRSSRAAKTTSASASRSGGSFDRSRLTAPRFGTETMRGNLMSSRNLFASILMACLLVARHWRSYFLFEGSSRGDRLGGHDLASHSGSNGEMLARLKDYTRSIGTEEPASMAAAGKLLPDVNTMIERLAARLETTPEDMQRLADARLVLLQHGAL